MTPEFDHYTISRVLGEGGMGLVYLASDRRTGLPVAIKVMSGRALDPELRARFLKENRILAGLNHRNIVRFYEVTESREGVVSIVMEYVDGVDFRAFEGRPFPELLPLMIQALMGLAYLRSQNILHRDLSSNNIFVTLENRTRVTKILDFGVAKILQEQAADGDVRTRTGQFLGKFAFASPEHFFPSEIDWRSDVYSLGVIFHRLVTGRPPITVARKSNYFDWMMAHQKEHAFEVLAPPDAPPLPDALRSVVRRMLARNREDRPQSYEEIIHVFDRVQRGLPSDLEPDPEELRTLPPPVEGRIGSSGSGKSGPTVSPSRLPAPGAGSTPSASGEPERPAPVESSQQKRWPDLDAAESHTERFVSQSPAAIPVVPAEPAGLPGPPSLPLEADVDASGPGGSPARTELLPPPAPLDATKTATTVTSAEREAPPEIPMWTGGAAKDVPPEPARLEPPQLEEKTERLDDVIEKLRRQALVEPLPPVPLRPTPEIPPPPPPPEPVRRPEAEPAVPRTAERAPEAPAKPGRRLVVYGAPPPAVPTPPPAAPRAVAPAAPAPVPDAADLRARRVGIALIVAAIVVLFAAVLWVLISLLRGPGAGASHSSRDAGPAPSVAAADPSSVHSESA
jgi:serine/threonine protein kinase